MTPRHDPVAERQLLALALSGHPTVRDKFLALPDGIWHPANEPIATVLRDRMRRDIPIDPHTIAADAATRANTDDQGARIHKLVLDCDTSCPPLDTWPHYAEQVLLQHTIRSAETHAHQLAQRLETITEPADLTAAVTDAITRLDGLADTLTQPGHTEPPTSLADLLAEADEPYDWIVPGLWERMDRIVLTAFEGCGKSTLMRQFALCLAAGIHPFTGDVINRHGHRVLVVDCENSRRQIRRQFRKHVGYIDFLREQAAMPPVDWADMLRLDVRPQGLDLSDPTEHARLESRIAAAAPDVVITGPLYRMSRLDIKDDEASKQVSDSLDQLRVKYRFTLLLEAHVGHVGEAQGGRKLRPFGSSLWLRWPEFGFGLRAYGDAAHREHPDLAELVAWRGSRDERHWPTLLKHGTDTLPWVVADHSYANQPTH